MNLTDIKAAVEKEYVALPIEFTESDDADAKVHTLKLRNVMRLSDEEQQKVESLGASERAICAQLQAHFPANTRGRAHCSTDSGVSAVIYTSTQGQRGQPQATVHYCSHLVPEAPVALHAPAVTAT